MPLDQILLGTLAGLGTLVVLAPLILLVALPPRRGRRLLAWLREAPRRLAIGAILGFVLAGILGLLVASAVEVEVVRKLAQRALRNGETWRSSRGFIVVTFPVTGQGLALLLPSDLAAGDVVSGIVTSERGPVRADRRSSLDVVDLADFANHVVVVEGTSSRLGSGVVSFAIPRRATDVELRLNDPDGSLVARVRVPVAPRRPPGGDALLPRLVPTRGLFTIHGRFDGDLRNTDIRVGDVALRPWAESPRRVVLPGPPAGEGAASLEVRDGGWSAFGPASVVGVAVTPRRLAARRGQPVPVTLTVSGLAPGEPAMVDVKDWTDGADPMTTSVVVYGTDATGGEARLTLPLGARADGMFRASARLRTEASMPGR